MSCIRTWVDGDSSTVEWVCSIFFDEGMSILFSRGLLINDYSLQGATLFPGHLSSVTETGICWSHSFVVDDMVVEVVFCIFGSSHVPEVMGIVVFCGECVIFSLKKGWVSCSAMVSLFVDIIFKVSSFSSFSLLMKTSFGLLTGLWLILKLFFWDCGRVAGFFGWQGN